MTAYTLHLGFRPDSPRIPMVWDPSDATSYQFLQYALDDGSQAMWFNQFYVDDTFSVTAWNLTPPPKTSPSKLPSIPTLTLRMSLGYLSAKDYQDGYKTYCPTDVLDLGSAASSKTDKHNSQSYFQFEAPSGSWYSPSSQVTCPWGAYSAVYYTGTVTFLDFTQNFDVTTLQCKLSFWLQCADGQTFISDPEVIVGSRGTQS